MIEQPILSSCVWVPFSWCDATLTEEIRYDNTYWKQGWKDEPDTEVKGYITDRELGAVGIPIDYGLKCLQNHFEGYDYHRALCEGAPADWPKVEIEPRDEEQEKFFNDLLAQTGARAACLAQAPTGSGKTVASLNTFKSYGGASLAVVPDSEVLEGWVKAAKKLFRLTDKQIGFVGGGRNDWEGKHLVIGIVNSIAKKRMPASFYTNFRNVAWDEAHRLGAKTFSRSMFKFPAFNKFALTATPDRKDGCEGLFLNNFGDPSVLHSGDAIPCDAVIHKWKVPGVIGFKMGGWMPNTVNGQLSRFRDRNRLIVKVTKELYSNGRNVIVFSHLIDHLAALRDQLMDAGVPYKQMGFLTKQRPDRKGNRVAVKRPYLDRIKEHARIIFTTYQFKAGIDIPRMDALVEATPVAEGIQHPGRIRRPFPDKPKPEVHSIMDTGVPRLEAMAQKRIAQYLEATIDVRYP